MYWRMCLLVWAIKVAQSIKILISRSNIGINGTMDAVFLPNSSMLLNNITHLFLLHPNSSQPSIFPLDVGDAKIMNLVRTESSIYVCTNAKIFLLDQHSLTILKTTKLPDFSEFSRISLIEQGAEIYYIPLELNAAAQFYEYRWGSSTKNRRFISQTSINQAQYFEGSSFVIAADTAGQIIIYNTSNGKPIDAIRLCDSSVGKMLVFGSKLTVGCQKNSYLCTMNEIRFVCDRSEFEGFELTLILQQIVFQINSSHFLFKNSTSASILQEISGGLGQIQVVLGQSDDRFANFTIIDAMGQLLRIDVEASKSDGISSFQLSNWELALIISGALFLIVIAIKIIFKFKKSKSQPKSYQAHKQFQENSQMTQILLESQ